MNKKQVDFEEKNNPEFREFLNGAGRVRVMTDDERIEFLKWQVDPQREKEFLAYYNKYIVKVPKEITFLVKKIEGFDEFLVPEAKKVHDTPVYNTVHEMLGENAGVRLTCYIQKTMEYTEETEKEKMQESVKWLADYFNKAVERGIVGYGCLAPASYLDLVPFGDNLRRRILFIYPVCKLEDSSKQNLNRLMEDKGKGFCNEGEINYEGLTCE